ncbi:hypothetical protein [Amycolatopsis sp. YIM 10]|uniref:hypothetical protein n=1 Tax=Amycolatopsis sp. YIM 10 TaxID=2653857 RepID=UPI0012906BA8|nr:hypothetical protein [Amycolatopsis sp. YIM 10]
MGENMSDKQTTVDVDPDLVEKLTVLTRDIAYMVCGEQPDVPQPENLRDLDSFLVVQVLLELENSTGVMMLEELEDAQAETFGELANNIIRIAVAGGSLAKLIESVAPDRQGEDQDDATAAAAEGQAATA